MIVRITQIVCDRINGQPGRRFFSALFASVAGRLGQLALSILLARNLGPENYGVFTFALSAAALTAAFATLGWPSLFNRLYPQFVRDKDWSRLKGLRDGADLVLITALGVGAVLLLAASRIDDTLRAGLVFAAMLVIPLGLLVLRQQQLWTLKRPALGLMFDQGFAAIVVATVVMVTGIVDLEAIILMYVGSTLFGLIVTTLVVRRLIPDQVSPARRLIEFGNWFRIALPIIVGTISRVLVNRMDVIMLAPLATLYAVGIFGAAWRLTYLLAFPQVVLMTVVTPLLSEAFAHGQADRIRRIMRLSAAYAFVTTAPFLLVFLFVPEVIMEWVFGSEFTTGGKTLMLLGIGQFFAAFTNANGVLLMMGGMEKQFGALNLVVVLIAIPLNFMLIPRFGANGAAITVIVATAAVLAGQVYYSRKLIGAMNTRTRTA